MRAIFLTGAVALACAVPAVIAAQDIAVTEDGEVYVLSDAQQAAYESWPPEQRTVYDAWPPEYRVYYWTLTPEQQVGYWTLTDDQRTLVYNMTPDQRAKAWAAIVAQAHGMVPPTPPTQANPPGLGVPTTGIPNPATASSPVRPAMPADPTYQGGPYKGALTPPPPEAMNKDYPVCGGAIQDSCINPGAVRED